MLKQGPSFFLVLAHHQYFFVLANRNNGFNEAGQDFLQHVCPVGFFVGKSELNCALGFPFCG
jgi:hypothetical protein